MKKSIFIISFLLLVSLAYAQFDPDAGVVVPYTYTGKVITHGGENPGAITDGSYLSVWYSEAILPVNYLSRTHLNGLMNNNRYKVGIGSTNMEACFDGDHNTSGNIAASEGLAAIIIQMKEPVSLARMSLKVNTGSEVKIKLIDERQSEVILDSYLPENNYGFKHYSYTKSKVHTIILQSEQSFQLFELGYLEGSITENVDFDFGQRREIQWIESRHLCGEEITDIEVYASLDKKRWRKVCSLNPKFIGYEVEILDKPVQARYLRYVYHMTNKEYGKASLWEVKVYDKHGPYGVRPLAKSSSSSIGDMLGLNVFWGLGFNVPSDEISNGYGVERFAPICKSLRSYHNMDWDINDPDALITLADIVQGDGLNSFSWKNWEREYANWTKKGMEITASIQFAGVFHDQSNYSNPYQSMYNYGSRFTKHFVNNLRLVEMMEIGNEPWHMTSIHYKQMLKGAVDGVRSINPNVKLFPCALSSVSNDWQERNMGAYSGDYLDYELCQKLTGFNSHYYSYIMDDDGHRKATYPENPESTFWGILNDIRFRDLNMPGKLIHVTEWGWDGAGGGEDCTHGECVSEQAQAVYAIRALFILNRLNVDRAYWFFYANTYGPSSLYTRSGLVSSSANGFKEKAILPTFESVLDKLRDSYFLNVIEESDLAWVYLLGDKNGKPEYIVAWRPIDVDKNNDVIYDLPKQYHYSKLHRIDGIRNIEEKSHRLRNHQIKVNAFPLIISLD
jgi:hypothetical protein